jgi:hypothetical protein
MFDGMNLPSAKGNVSGSQRSVNQRGLSRIAWRGAKWSSKLTGGLCLVLVLLTPVFWLCFYGETFFSLTRRVPAEVLVVEGWIGNDGIRAAAAEFETADYRYIVATGGQTDNRPHSRNYAEIAGEELIRSGIPKDRLIIAPTGEIERERTFKSAVAAWQALQHRGIHTEDINVLTLGPHARRSRLVYAKVFAPAAHVGVIAWTPSDYETGPWWQSRGRTKCFLKEIVGYPFEVLLNSGRISNAPG